MAEWLGIMSMKPGFPNEGVLLGKFRRGCKDGSKQDLLGVEKEWKARARTALRGKTSTFLSAEGSVRACEAQRGGQGGALLRTVTLVPVLSSSRQ